ncbi:scavenger receptor cysteine-rich type 1 protein M130-like [Anomaloglossus baeobatrachus]|uniref:scavenger receptor cysteine-rich type 1 protein M130-like n=1 Tax=Anomaloglossus baeobatrachus TaxID=238106 RepID=UPI003F4F83C2
MYQRLCAEFRESILSWRNMYEWKRKFKVDCSSVINYREYRLVDGSDPCSGHLEAQHGDTWGSICEIDSELRAANVICRETNCGHAVPSLLNYTRRLDQKWTEQIHCTGNETRLLDCARKPGEQMNCSKQYPSAIQCKESKRLRLVNGPGRCAGKVEIYYNGNWGTICGHFWDKPDADVVCKQLDCGYALNATNEVSSEPGGADCGQASRGRLYLLQRSWMSWVKAVMSQGTRSDTMKDLIKHLVQTQQQQKQAKQEMNRLFIQQQQLALQETNKLFIQQLQQQREQQQRQIEVLAEVIRGRVTSPGNDANVRKAVRRAMQKMTPGDDVEAFLTVFERVVEREKLPPEQWAKVLAPYLSREPQKAYYDLALQDAKEYDNLKAEIVAHLGVTMTVRAQWVHQWAYHGDKSPHSQMFDLLHLVQKWLQPESSTPVQMVERVVMDRFLHSLLKPVQTWVARRNPLNADDLVGLVERYQVVESSRGKSRDLPFPYWGISSVSDTQKKGKAGSIKLIGENDHCVGRLEILINNTWSRASSDQWGINETHVVCRELSCGHAVGTFIIPTPDTINGHVDLSGNCQGNETKLSDCSVPGSSDLKTWTGNDIEIICSERQQLRLTRGPSSCAGRVEIYHSGKWRTICPTIWHEEDANVVCRQLGCGTVSDTTSETYLGRGSGDIWLVNILCTGQESHIWNCETRPLSIYNCIQETDAGVICSGHREYRLVDGPNTCSGHLESLHGNEWGSVCEIDAELNTANVFCKELHCGEAVPALINYPRRKARIWTEEIHCTGNETRLIDCARKPGEKRTCSNQYPPAIQCKGIFNSYRLVNGSHLCSGRVEILYEGRWMAMCSSHWTLREANVLCRQIKCGVVVSIPDRGHFGKFNISTKYRFHCTGTEYHLGDCSVTALGNGDCPPWDTAGVICTGKEQTVRLMDGEDHCVGRLEILTNNTWSRASSDQWGINETHVVCREIHCGHAVGSYIRESTAINGYVYLSGKCLGNETRLSDCSISKSSEETDQKMEIEVICSESKQLRLVNGSARCVGRVEIYHDGRWGTICDDSWDKSDADVVCKQLDCGSAVKGTTGAYYGRGTGDIWLDDVECVGNETYIWNCPSKQFGKTDCGHKEDAGVICSEFLDLRLVDGPHECEGWLEVYYNGRWGFACNNVMPEFSLSVICKHLNCGSKGYLDIKMGDVSKGSFWVDHINCTKHSKLLWECPSSPWSTNPCSNRDYAYLVCEKNQTSIQSCPESEPCTDNDRIRLTGGDNRCSGRVEVFYQGQWGTVCNDDWDIHDANVVCRQVGCGSAMTDPTEARFEKGTGPIWLSEVQCKGYERALQDCWSTRWNKSDCLHKEDAGVICDDHGDHFTHSVLTITTDLPPSLPDTTLNPNVFLIISIISLLLLGIAIITIIFLIRQSKWSKKYVTVVRMRSCVFTPPTPPIGRLLSTVRIVKLTIKRRVRSYTD